MIVTWIRSDLSDLADMVLHPFGDPCAAERAQHRRAAEVRTWLEVGRAALELLPHGDPRRPVLEARLDALERLA